MLQYLRVFLHIFREVQCNSERSSVESDILEESQQDVPQDDPVYSNVDNPQQQISRMPGNLESDNDLEHSEHPGYATISLSPRRKPQKSGNPDCRTVVRAAPSATKAKPALSSATGSVICWTTVDRNINQLFIICLY